MPIVNVVAKKAWLPTDPYWDTDEQEVTWNLINALPTFIVAALNAVDGTGSTVHGSGLSTSEVLVVPSFFQPMARNAPDLWIDIQPSEKPGDDYDQLERRLAIMRHVQVSIEDLLKQFVSEKPERKRPAYDIECRPFTGSGESMNPGGQITQSWGETP